jgi:hypothetical protein
VFNCLLRINATCQNYLRWQVTLLKQNSIKLVPDISGFNPSIFVTNLLRIFLYSSVFILITTDIILFFRTENSIYGSYKQLLNFLVVYITPVPLNKEHLQCFNWRNELWLLNSVNSWNKTQGSAWQYPRQKRLQIKTNTLGYFMYFHK